MASLRDTVKDYQEDLRDGIAWVAFWKTGRSWNAEDFHLELGDYLYPEDRSRMEEIKQADPAAVVVNGYYSGYLGEDMNLDKLTAGVRRHYENGYSNIGEFIEAHDDRLPPELLGDYYPINDRTEYTEKEWNMDASDRPDIEVYHCRTCGHIW